MGTHLVTLTRPVRGIQNSSVWVLVSGICSVYSVQQKTELLQLLEEPHCGQTCSEQLHEAQVKPVRWQKLQAGKVQLTIIKNVLTLRLSPKQRGCFQGSKFSIIIGNVQDFLCWMQKIFIHRNTLAFDKEYLNTGVQLSCNQFPLFLTVTIRSLCVDMYAYAPMQAFG